jgi:hypothetical protein
LKLLGSIAAAAAAVAERDEDGEYAGREAKERPSSIRARAAASRNAVYKRLLLLQLLLLRLLRLRMGIEMKKTKTRRPSWRRLALERRNVRQLITLSGSKPATRRWIPHHRRLLVATAMRSVRREAKG